MGPLEEARAASLSGDIALKESSEVVRTGRELFPSKADAAEIHVDNGIDQLTHRDFAISASRQCEGRNDGNALASFDHGNHCVAMIEGRPGMNDNVSAGQMLVDEVLDQIFRNQWDQRLVVRIAPQKHLFGIFLVPGLIVFCYVYFFAATHSLVLLKSRVFLAALLVNGAFSLWGNYLPRVYPTHLRGTGESFALNIGPELSAHRRPFSRRSLPTS